MNSNGRTKSKSEMRRLAIMKGCTEPYWICNDCAMQKGWESPKWDVTVISGLCGHCDREDETMLTPTRDFTKNGVPGDWD